MIGVSCDGDGGCAAAGVYVRGDGEGAGLLETLIGGAWTGVEAALPSDAGADPDTGLQEVSCAGGSTCVAVGSYIDSIGESQGLLETSAVGLTAPNTRISSAGDVPGLELSQQAKP
jgi:hypothetical protein